MKQIGSWIWKDVEATGSTNDEAYTLSCELHLPCVVTAREQNKGRGRRGRSWIGYKDNLFMSFSFPMPSHQIGQVVILSGLAILRLVQSFCPEVKVEVKWPNDVLVDGAKISGILFEKGPNDFWIMGIGVNIVAHPEPCQAGYATTGLNYLGANTNRLEAFKRFVRIWDDIMTDYQDNGFCNLRQAWLDNAFKLDKKIIIRQDNKSTEGVFKGIDDNGCLLLEQEGQDIKVLVGDVFGIKQEEEK